MRRTATVLLVVSLPFAACGGDNGDDESGGGGGVKADAETTTGSLGTVDKGELESCLSDADLRLRSGGEPYTDPKGQRRTRQGLEIEETKYVGYVRWPSRHISDIYVSSDEAAATTAQSEAGNFVRAFGLDPATYVQKHGNLVLVFDRPVPTEEEVKAVAGCA